MLRHQKPGQKQHVGASLIHPKALAFAQLKFNSKDFAVFSALLEGREPPPLDMPLIEVFSTRICTILHREGMATLRHLVLHSEEYLMGAQGMGNRTLATIRHELAERGLYLGMIENE